LAFLPSAGMKSTGEKQSEEETTPQRSSEVRRLFEEYAASPRALSLSTPQGQSSPRLSGLRFACNWSRGKAKKSWLCAPGIFAGAASKAPIAGAGVRPNFCCGKTNIATFPRCDACACAVVALRNDLKTARSPLTRVDRAAGRAGCTASMTDLMIHAAVALLEIACVILGMDEADCDVVRNFYRDYSHLRCAMAVGHEVDSRTNDDRNIGRA
jgi:hypothetical protein